MNFKTVDYPLVFHGTNQILKTPAVRRMKHVKEYRNGFYCTNERHVAEYYANLTDNPTVNVYQIRLSKNVIEKDLETPSYEWLELMWNCLTDSTFRFPYNIIYSPIPDNVIYSYLDDFKAGKHVSLDNLYKELIAAHYKNPRYQVTFHDLRGILALDWIDSYEV